MKKYRINDILGDNNGQQQNGVDCRHIQGLQSGQQRTQLTQNIQNRIQRRYEADGSEEEEMRFNQLLNQSIGCQSLQRNVNSVPTDEHLVNNMDTNGCNIDANTLYSKLKELQEAEQRLKQVEDLMKSIEKMENNIKEVKRDSTHNKETRKTMNENQTNYMSRNAGNNISHNVNKSGVKSISTQPKQLSQSSNNISQQNPQQKNIISRNLDENNLDLNNSCQQFLSQTIDFSDNNLGYTTDLDESESNSEDSFNLLNGNLIRSMRSQFDSMRSQFETMIPVLENQCINNSNVNNGNSLMNNQQFFHLMLLQNYQIMQQQQMLLLWLQQQQQTRPQQPVSHHYFNSRQTNMSGMTQNGPHYRNATLNSVRNNDMNSHNVTAALNNQVVPGVRANNYWDNFKSYSRQNKFSSNNCGVNTNNFSTLKGNENLLMTSNQMVSPIVGLDQQNVQNIQNANHSQDTNAMSPSSTLGRHSYKAANASHLQCVEHAEKQLNLPINDSIHCKQTHNQPLDSNNFAAIFSMLEKLMESDDKYASKSAIKKKSTNLVINTDNDEDSGAVGGVGVSNVNNQIPIEDSNENNGSNCQQSSSSSRNQITSNSQIAVHIPASSGAIRKKPRNHETLELTIKTDNGDSFGHPLVNGSEMIRPLMPAEGRSSEIAVSAQKGQILAIRPPTTGATDFNDSESGSNASSDDDLAEADQTASDLITSESEIIFNNNNVIIITTPTNTNSVNLDLSQRSNSENNDTVVDANDGKEEEEFEEEETLLANTSNESGVRLSGDGQGFENGL